MSDTRQVTPKIEPENHTNKYTFDSPAITASMTIYAHIINRLASNSNKCKTLGAGLVGLIVGLKTDISGWHMIIVLICVLAISYQDCMYVGLKKKLEGVAQDLRIAVVTGDYSTIGPFMIPESCHGFMYTIKFWRSKSIWIFYLPMMAAVFGVWLVKSISSWF